MASEYLHRVTTCAGCTQPHLTDSQYLPPGGEGLKQIPASICPPWQPLNIGPYGVWCSTKMMIGNVSGTLTIWYDDLHIQNWMQNSVHAFNFQWSTEIRLYVAGTAPWVWHWGEGICTLGGWHRHDIPHLLPVLVSPRILATLLCEKACLCFFQKMF